MVRAPEAVMVAKNTRSIRFPEEMMKDLEECAWAERMTVSELVRAMVRAQLSQRRKERTGSVDDKSVLQDDE